MTKFTSGESRIKEFIRMAELLGFLETSTNKADKVCEIKMAQEDGLISEDEAIELVIEFC